MLGRRRRGVNAGSVNERRMHRGVYFDAWYPRQHNYHPSFPARRLRMIEDLESYHATVLFWSALGGGAISLPYLEEEAFGEVGARARIYGFLNDSEFMAECGERGISVFAVVFEHAWEYPVELSEDGTKVLAWNELRGAGERSWLGMREFWQNRYPKLWKPVEHYFPSGLKNSEGEPVTDILEECAQRDIHGEPCRALWVECPDRDHYNYMMDRNNPVWREYLKAEVRIQIDAGAQGIQFDEAEVPITSLQYGGCFCATCVAGFREYLQGLEPRPSVLDGIDLSAFHYDDWLKDRGFDFKSNREETPLFWDYLRFQRGNIVRYFAELSDYAHGYAREKGRDVLVTGNFFNLFDHYYAMEPKVDLIVTEMRNTTYRQPAWYRYAAGFARGKPLVVVENPYGGVVPELLEQLKAGRGYDRFRTSLLEAAALGVNMSVPYGSWMGSEIQDAFYAPHDLCVQIQDFLAENEHRFSADSASEVGVIFSIESAFRAVASRELFADNRTNAPGEARVSFWEVCESLSDASQPYDVVFFPDGELRPDDMQRDDLLRYRTVVAPDCSYLTDVQASTLGAYLDRGGRLLILGKLGENLEPGSRSRILEHPGSIAIEGFDPGRLPDEPQIRIEPADDIALTLQRLDGATALHFIRYSYDERTDKVPALAELDVSVRLEHPVSVVEAASFDGSLSAELESSTGDVHHLKLRNVPLSGIVVLQR
jgi:hypothetical protein